MNLEIKKIDQVLDYIPIISAVNAIVQLIAKVAMNTLFNKNHSSSITTHQYLNLSKDKSYFRLMIVCIPVIGNIFVALSDYKLKSAASAFTSNSATKTQEIEAEITPDSQAKATDEIIPSKSPIIRKKRAQILKNLNKALGKKFKFHFNKLAFSQLRSSIDMTPVRRLFLQKLLNEQSKPENKIDGITLPKDNLALTRYVAPHQALRQVEEIIKFYIKHVELIKAWQTKVNFKKQVLLLNCRAHNLSFQIPPSIAFRFPLSNLTQPVFEKSNQTLVTKGAISQLQLDYTRRNKPTIRISQLFATIVLGYAHFFWMFSGIKDVNGNTMSHQDSSDQMRAIAFPLLSQISCILIAQKLLMSNYNK